jgi:formate--tetrahydrofolate ligase
VVATRLALHIADWAVTEAGFASDLGAEKFFDIVCRNAQLDAAAVVLVTTVRALKSHGGAAAESLARPDAARVGEGLPNLDKHIENVRLFGEQPVVALNRFPSDTEDEIAVVRRRCKELAVPFAVADHHARGGAGAEELARLVVEHAERQPAPPRLLYELDDPVPEKVAAVARNMYGARDVAFTKQAHDDLAEVRRLGFDRLPVCIAKTQASLSDDPSRRGRPTDFTVTVRSIQINAGAGFLVVLTGDMLRMPGLPRKPLAASIDLRDGHIIGLG